MTIAAKNIVLANNGQEIRLQDVLDTLNVFLAEHAKASFPTSFSLGHYSQLEIDDQVGKKYIRIWSNSCGSRSAYCFLDYEGNIYKPATWKAPAKHVRGSVFDKDCSWGKGLGPYGAAYLK